MPIIRRVANALFPEEVDSVDVHRARRNDLKVQKRMARHPQPAPHVVFVTAPGAPLPSGYAQPQAMPGQTMQYQQAQYQQAQPQQQTAGTYAMPYGGPGSSAQQPAVWPPASAVSQQQPPAWASGASSSSSSSSASSSPPSAAPYISDEAPPEYDSAQFEAVKKGGQ